MRALKYYIISVKSIFYIIFYFIKFVVVTNCLANSEESLGRIDEILIEQKDIS